MKIGVFGTIHFRPFLSLPIRLGKKSKNIKIAGDNDSSDVQAVKSSNRFRYQDFI